jgi:hypothetical protein
MGITLFGNKSWSSYEKNEIENQVIVIGNPVPTNYEIINNEIVNDFLILVIKYPDAKNYEGIKVLLYDKNVTVDQLTKQVAIDPHFSNNKKYISPVARFEPTDRGLMMARLMCENMVS